MSGDSPRLLPLVMNERQRTARKRLRLIVAQAPRNQSPAQADREGALPGLREVPALPLRFGRHVTAWLLWHTSRVSLISDAPPPTDLNRTARV
jgi:hypothetical protein